MEGLFRKSLEEKKAITIMYMSPERVITDRNIIVRAIKEDYIRAYCFKRNQLRTFKRENILAVANQQRRKRSVSSI